MCDPSPSRLDLTSHLSGWKGCLWTPRLGISLDFMEIPWNPLYFHGFHGNTMESIEILWNPWKYHGIHGNTWNP